MSTVQPDHLNQVATQSAFQFLVAATCRAPQKELLSRWDDLGGNGIEELLWLAGELGVHPVLKHFVLTFRSRIDPGALRRLLTAGMISGAPGRFALELVRRLVACPSLQGAESIAVKGAALEIQGLTRADRFFVDVDLVIPPADLPRWTAAVATQGARMQRGDVSGYELAYVLDDRCMIELHGALPGLAGSEHGPAYDALRAHATMAEPGLWVPSAAVSREIAVQHFVAHHHGEPAHALRTIQDLVALEDAGEGSGLEWSDPEIAGAVAHFRHIARAAAAGGDRLDRDARDFFEGLFRILLFGHGAHEAAFSDTIDHWMDAERSQGRSGVSLLARRLFPPVVSMRRSVDEGHLRTAARYAARPAQLLFRYLRGSVQRVRYRRRTAELKRWRALLSRNPDHPTR